MRGQQRVRQDMVHTRRRTENRLELRKRRQHARIGLPHQRKINQAAVRWRRAPIVHHQLRRKLGKVGAPLGHGGCPAAFDDEVAGRSGRRKHE